ncbi:hypothetical protein E1B28_013185 [Marasmius oreades]|uniref:Uncharacterized protein n=1 Tax=Marasmius oreades TaxID=181124 RepID=A0A9P7RP77_9AGAR|nr:uncharacterized protein E1B28_013185 [Marasmius oreades]KAG7087204.1 hypothetical protein E1B28_013185 [Marasmius oreades]
MHLKPFIQMWDPGPLKPVQRLYSQAYTSDRMLALEKEVMRSVPDNCEYEVVVVAIMHHSDSTNLTHFGTASLWPGYKTYGNMSKYLQLNLSQFTVNHVVYVPKFPDSFCAEYERLVDETATTEVLRYCKRELIHLVWGLLLNNPKFVDAYLNVTLERCADGIMRLLFPRLFPHSADYVEK